MRYINSLLTFNIDIYVIYVRDLHDGRPQLYPEYNYLSGTGLSTVWMRHNHYAPHNRQWQRHHDKRALPNDRVAGQVEFVSEDQWRDWQLRRDQHDSKYCGGYGKFLWTSLNVSCWIFCALKRKANMQYMKWNLLWSWNNVAKLDAVWTVST